MPSPNGDHQQINDLNAVTATSPDDAWAVGLSEGKTEDSLLLHWNGRVWSRVHATDVGRINYLSTAGTSSAWASGDCGLLGWNGRSWRLTSFRCRPPRSSRRRATWPT